MLAMPSRMAADDLPSTQLTVPATAAGERLDSFLAQPLGSRAAAQRLIDAGVVTVDGVARPKRHRVAAGEQVRWRQPPVRGAPAPSADVPFAIRFEDEHLLIVDKPAGVVVHPGRGHPTGTLAQALAGRIAGGQDSQRPGIVHRLDRDTSGLLAIARSDAVHRALARLIRERAIHREYLALVEGHPPARSGTIDAPLGRDRRVRTRMSSETDAPKEARTHFDCIELLPTTALLRVRLETGRTHQIRAHLRAIGHPVVGDPAYGQRGVLGLQRQFLHAARLAFVHPMTGAQLDISSPLPEDLRAALARARAAV